MIDLLSFYVKLYALLSIPALCWLGYCWRHRAETKL